MPALLRCCLLACAAPFTLAVTTQLIDALDGGKMKLVRRSNSWCPKLINIALRGFDVKLDILPCFVHESVELKKVEHNVQNVKESALNALSTRVSTMDFLLNMHASDVDNLRFMTCANTTELTTKTTELAENITELTTKTTELAENITELGEKINGLREELTEKTTELAESITELGEKINGLREDTKTLSAKIDLFFVGMLAIAVYMKMDTDAKLGRLLFAFMLMCAHAFRYAKRFNNAMSFIHLGRCYTPAAQAQPRTRPPPAGVTSAARRSPGCQSPPWRPSDLRFGLRLSIS